ncbi:MAG: undecaprenyl/decaprenyl-phosphate alpha-N-acetylglucosaminyl 1-phosphate transferase [Bacteroidota bacterium]|nr:undecaprenyl/decaprenyl-phosphate alpha-N-acetylglucosaminyl 1-phosphate transferase [Bacteroidota bacterium]
MEGKLYLFIIYGSYFLATVILSFLINGLFLKFASTLGIRNPNETIIRWSPAVKPSLGGISFYLIFLLSVASYSIFFEHSQIILNKQLIGLLASCTLAFLMGLSDDAYNTKPFLKLIIQVCCAIILISTGTYISLFDQNYLNYILTVFWVVGLMNSINMLDNMDAITTVVSIIIIISALVILYINGDGYSIHIIILIGVLSALIGFLFFNWHPSKMFMGDTGSQFLGLFLAAMGITYFWNTPDTQGKLIQSKQFFVTILAFAIPIIDTTTVVINRLLKKKSPFIGGKDHTTHSLFYMGVTEKRIAILYAGICFTSLFFNLLIIKYIENWGYLHILLFSVYFISLFWLLYSPSRKNIR